MSITIHFSDRERVQLRKDQELELEQSLRIDNKVPVNAKILMKSILYKGTIIHSDCVKFTILVPAEAYTVL